jgi:hypothetical protein
VCCWLCRCHVQELIRRQQDIENAKRLIKADDDMPTEL